VSATYFHRVARETPTRLWINNASARETELAIDAAARKPRHFTETVGGDVHIAINWDMAEKLIQGDDPVEPRMDVQTPEAVIKETCAKFEDCRRAYIDDALAPEEFADFGGVGYFRDMFLNGYAHLHTETAAHRAMRIVEREQGSRAL